MLITDATGSDALFPAQFGRGHDPGQVVPRMFAPPADLRLIPRSEWDARIDEQEAQQSSLEHMRDRAPGGMPTLDQNGQGYCWAYSVTRSVMYARLVANLPLVRLSAHSVGCKIKNFRDEGGWCGLSQQFIKENGVCDVSAWPEKSMSRANDTPAAWENAKRYRIEEDWVDLAKEVWNRGLTFDQVATCLLLNVPVVCDFNWWGHSVIATRLVRVEAGSYGLRIDNSWTDQWGDRGKATLQGSRAIPDGAVATRSVALFA
ncbi:MAG TPA: hypothetical protein VGE74_25770 [Gemmata sp.]